MSYHFKKFITVIILPLLINCINKEKKELSGTLQVIGRFSNNIAYTFYDWCHRA